MNINSVTIDVCLENKDIESIAYSMYYSMKRSVENHYKNHTADVFLKQEKHNIDLMTKFFSILGNHHLAVHFISELEKDIELSQKEKNK